MPLNDGYGVVIGTKHNYYRDPPDNYGRYYHGNLEIATPGGIYKGAIDVDPKAMPDGIQCRSPRLRSQDFTSILALANGWHALASNASSGALDYIRSGVLHPPFLISRVRFGGWLQRFFAWLRWNPPWNSGTGIQALESLEAIITGGKRFFIFGEPFSHGLGVHSIHQNQGDPLGTPWAAENGIWQDGATIVEHEDGTLRAFLNKFKTQAFKTDDQGRPR